MKHFKYMAMAAAGMLLATSCASDEAPVTPGDGNVNFTIELPADLATRAFGDGQKATALTYAVYEKGSTSPVILSEEEVTFSGLKATVSLKLVNGKSYDIIWWGAVPGNTFYTFNPATQSVDISYTGIVTNDENRDAFFQHTSLDVNGPVNETIRLYRPFAQLNFGTDDLNEPAVKAAFGNDYATLTTTATVSAYTTLNLMTEEVSGNTTVTYAPAGIPSGETFPVNGYDYLSMDYLLMTKDREIQDITFSVLENGTKEFNKISIASVPFQRNYRTNIYGQLLTSTSNYNVVIEPPFNEPSYDIDLWDGSVETPSIDENAKTVTVTSGAELAGLAQMVNGGTNTLEGYTVKLTQDINLAGKSWEPIGVLGGSGETGSSGTTKFAGIFDGQGHTIYNLTASATGNNASAGLFGRLCGTVKNLTLKDVNISSDHYAGAIAGYTYINTYYATPANAAIINCTVDGGTITTTPNLQPNGTYDNGDKAGALTGYAGMGRIEISNNTVKNLTITGYREIGSLIGFISVPNDAPNHDVTGSDNTASDVKIIQNLTHNYKNLAPKERTGELIGGVDVPANGFPTGIATNVTISVVE